MELISRERAIEDICSIESEVAKKMPYDKDWFDRMCDRQHEIIEIIKALPTIEIERTGNTVTMTSEKFFELMEKAERPRGEWHQSFWNKPIDIEIKLLFYYKCDFCDKEVMVERIDGYNYCPNCGAQMEVK